MDNTIVADNTTVITPTNSDLLDNGDPYGTSLVGSHDLVGAGNLGNLAGTLSGVDPQLGMLQNNGGPTWTQAIPISSPAVGAGDPTLLPAGMSTDQRGQPFFRLVQGQLDIGAFEIQTIRRTLPPPSKTPTPVSPIVTPIIGLTIDPTNPPHRTNS
jgi:hypothetical protein